MEIRDSALEALISVSDLTFINANRNLITYGAGLQSRPKRLGDSIAFKTLGTVDWLNT